MGKKKRTSRRTGLVGRAVGAGRRALKEAESRIPPDRRRQLQQRLKDADKTARAAIKQLQTQVQRASTRTDVNSVLKRIDSLTRQARQIAGRGGTRATRKAATTRRATSRTKKATTRRPAARRRTTATRPAATRAAATRAAAPRKATAPRRRRPPATTAPVPEIIEVPITEVGEIDVYEITES